MTLAQTTEFITMFVLARLLVNWRFKWVFAAGLIFGFLRYGLCVLNGRVWVLAGVALHGFAFTLFFITGQIYLDQRVDQTWRARSQALLSLASNGVGSLIGYLGTGWWFKACESAGGVSWRLFWGGLTLAVAAVLIYFIAAYRGKQGRATHGADAN
jgi:MFS family permease